MTGPKPSHFERLGLAPSFRLDEEELAQRFRRLQAAVHPDRFAGGSPAERRLALQLAADGNEAYRVLSNPTLRAAHLCEVSGVPVDAERNTSMSPSFLRAQMEYRERIDEIDEMAARDDCRRALHALRADIDGARARTREEVARLLDDVRDPAGAAAVVRELMFHDKLLEELRRIERRIEREDDAGTPSGTRDANRAPAR
ncbi:MAG: Fe-S protein assembly co-chaperone HscB [Lautropia sp.]